MREKVFGIVGAGVVGTLMAVCLERSGLFRCVGIHTRSRASFERFRKFVSCEHCSLAELAQRCSVIFVTTPDDVIAQVARVLHDVADAGAVSGERMLIHCSGALPWRVLAPEKIMAPEKVLAPEKVMAPEKPMASEKVLASEKPMASGALGGAGWRYAGVHPYRAFASIVDGIDSMEGTHFGIDGSDEQAVFCGEEIVRVLGGVAYRVPEGGKTLYHGAAVIASNYLVTLASIGVELLERISLTPGESLELLLPLMQGTLDNLRTGGLDVLTGPVARGDTEVVGRHLRELPDDVRDVYCALGRWTLKLGRRQRERAGKAYAPEVEQELNRLFGQ
ncbi:MAG: DUF2520 domain-containing protein [Gracilibacteraceae bacterium]|nr:DUF2520 domain-containing protein [Gracilibacteraceae bacterium]